MIRSFLFVPGDSERKLEKAPDAGADAIIVDLEDSVTAENRPRARELAREFIEGREDAWLRINPVDSGEAMADLQAVMPAAPSGIMLPKGDKKVEDIIDLLRQVPFFHNFTREQIESLISRTLEAYGQVDVLFNNAGFGRLAWLEDLDPQDDIDRQVQVDLLGLIHTSRAVLPHMIQRRRGHIINMASIAGLIAPPTYSIYAASKFGIAGFTQALRREVDLYGIRVSGIYPGGVATEFEQHVQRPSQVQISTPGWLTLSAQQVAQEVWRIAGRPRRMVVIPRVMWLAVWLNAIAPGLVDTGIRILFTRKLRRV